MIPPLSLFFEVSFSNLKWDHSSVSGWFLFTEQPCFLVSQLKCFYFEALDSVWTVLLFELKVSSRFFLVVRKESQLELLKDLADLLIVLFWNRLIVS
jgi:hypothetical protein